jgi:hypothetical protein
MVIKEKAREIDLEMYMYAATILRQRQKTPEFLNPGGA